MTKEEHINYWKALSKDDFETAKYNMEGGKNLPALFFFHLSLEKMLKAHWVKDNLNNSTIFTHDLQKIASETDIHLESAHFELLSVVNIWNIEARYPDFKNTLKKIATKEYTFLQFERVKSFLEWLENQL